MTRLSQPQRTSLAMLALLLLGLTIYVVRVTGPSDLLDNDQMRPASYALDIVANGQWVVQTDYGGNPASKPPFSTWVTALISLPQGKVTLWTLYLPCALAVALSAILLVWFAGTGFGLMAGLAAGVMLMLSPLGEKHIALARTDAMFLLTTTTCAALAWQVMRAGPPRAWLCFWIMATIATLTKGPLGIALGGMGVLSRWWPGSREDRPVREPGQRRALIVWNLLGVGLLAVICLGWVVAAITVLGDAFVDRVILHELAGHAAGYQMPSDVQATSLTGIASITLHWLVDASKPTLYLISRFAPWSLLGLSEQCSGVHEPRYEQKPTFRATFFYNFSRLNSMPYAENRVHFKPIMLFCMYLNNYLDLWRHPQVPRSSWAI